MSYTVQDMQREVLLAANKAQADSSVEEITAALQAVIDKLEEPIDAPSQISGLGDDS